MRVGRHVDRHACHRSCQIGSVIEVKSAQIVLVCLAFAAVLAYHQARDCFEHFACSQNGTIFQLLGRDGSLGGGIRRSDEILSRVGYLHGLQSLHTATEGGCCIPNDDNKKNTKSEFHHGVNVFEFCLQNRPSKKNWTVTQFLRTFYRLLQSTSRKRSGTSTQADIG